MTARKLDRTRFAHVDITTGGQVVHCSAVMDSTPVPVRYRIHHDTSHVSQSYAVAEVWSAGSLSWNEAATYSPGLWAEDSGSAYDTRRGASNPTVGIEDALHVLELRVRRLLHTED